jgi:uncharacterized protein YjiS (DUF1127 family)
MKKQIMTTSQLVSKPERVVSRWTRVKQTVAEWRRRVRSRSELANLDESDLQDSGISRSMAEFEASKPFWKA